MPRKKRPKPPVGAAKFAEAEEIGEGQFGTVFRMRDITTQEIVAVKQMPRGPKVYRRPIELPSSCDSCCERLPAAQYTMVASRCMIPVGIKCLTKLVGSKGGSFAPPQRGKLVCTWSCPCQAWVSTGCGMTAYGSADLLDGAPRGALTYCRLTSTFTGR